MRIIDPKLLAEFSRKPLCEYCGRYSRNKLEPHHIRKRKMDGGERIDHPFNLVALCGAFENRCHEKAECGEIRKEILLSIVALREGKTVEEITGFLDRVRRADKNGEVPSS